MTPSTLASLAAVTRFKVIVRDSLAGMLLAEDGSAPQPLVVGVDVGSVRRRGGFSWAAAEGDWCGADDVGAFVDVVVAALDRGRRVALAFECPLAVPVPRLGNRAWRDLGKARTGDGARSWSASAGASAMATGLVQVAWVLLAVARGSVVAPMTTTQLSRFVRGMADLMIAEAMVTSRGKPEPVGGSQDHADALAAARRLHEIVAAASGGQPEAPDVTCHPYGALNLAAAAAMWAGLPIDPDELDGEVVVANARPVRER